MKVCFTGDLFIGGDLLAKPINRKDLISSPAYHSASLRIANLEQSFGSADNRLENKCTLHAPSKAITLANDLKINVAALSNNHLQDLGSNQITDTFRQLNKRGVSYFGAGNNKEDAKTPYWINESTCILGYCESDKPYLKKVQQAYDDQPGVNLLSYTQIVDDLNKLAPGSKAILHLHWGREHVALPDYANIALAKKLLTHDNVLMIIGMHAHRIQGIIEHNEKKAYMCLGNFLFPNFYLEPRTHIIYPEIIPDNTMTTKDYHFVGKITYKKWRLKNRISLLVVFDAITNAVYHTPVLQNPDNPKVEEMSGLKKHLILLLVNWYSLIYRLPKPIYLLLHKTNVAWNKFYRYSYAFVFLARQNGVNWIIGKTLKYLRKAD